MHCFYFFLISLLLRTRLDYSWSNSIYLTVNPPLGLFQRTPSRMDGRPQYRRQISQPLQFANSEFRKNSQQVEKRWKTRTRSIWFTFLCTSPTSQIQQIFVRNFDGFSPLFKQNRQHFANFVPICAETRLMLDHQDQNLSESRRKMLPNAGKQRNIANFFDES